MPALAHHFVFFAAVYQDLLDLTRPGVRRDVPKRWRERWPPFFERASKRSGSRSQRGLRPVQNRRARAIAVDELPRMAGRPDEQFGRGPTMTVVELFPGRYNRTTI